MIRTDASTRRALAALTTFALIGAALPAQANQGADLNASLPEAVRVPAGNTVLLQTLAMGQITYECKESKDAPGTHAWTFVVPHATLYDSANAMVGRYFGGPTWEHTDGSRVVGKQVAVSPNTGTPKSIPLQLVQAASTTGEGAMNKVSYIQRLNTKGGVAPATACDASNKGARQLVSYEADYVLYTRM